LAFVSIRAATALDPQPDSFRVEAILTFSEAYYRDRISPREFINALAVNSQHLCHFIGDENLSFHLSPFQKSKGLVDNLPSPKLTDAKTARQKFL
jgi:hypothetical protein